MTMIKRKILNDIRSHLQAPEITMIIGPRQVGKTTLMKMVERELKDAGYLTVFFNLDYEADAQYFQSQQYFLNKIKLEIGTQKGFVFIDEFQRKENAGLFLKGIYDLGLPYKFIISGSGSLGLKEKIKESLTGRKRIFELLPVSFEEFIHYKTGYAYEDRFLEFIEIEKVQIQNYLQEYLIFGGYPRVVTEEIEREKALILEEIFTSYVERDLVYLLKIDRPEIFTQLIRLLAAHIGQIIQYSNLATSLGLSLQTLKKYLWMAEQTFIIYFIRPFYSNIKKELIKSPIVYFHDLGLRNYSLRRLQSEVDPRDVSFIFQNFVFNALNEKVREKNLNLHFWRTKDKAEVDLVINKFDEIIPVEIKYISLQRSQINRSLRSFIEKYNPEQAWVINLSLEDEIQISNTKVKFLPFYKLLIF